MMKAEICACCFLRYAPERFSPTDKRPQVCVECMRHFGNAAQRDADHLRDWRAAHAQTTKSYEGRLSNMRKLLDASDAEKAELQSALSDAIDTISSEFHKAPIGDLRNALETALVTEERDRAESAFKIRSRAMVVIWRVDQFHNTIDTKSTDVCKCGDRADQCQTLAAVAPFTEELDKWESRERERMRAGKTHGLPAEHPDAKEYMRDPNQLWRGPGRFGEPRRASLFGQRG